MNNINLLKPSPTKAEIDAVTEVLESGWWGTGPKVDQFEKEFAKYVGAKHCVAVNSCTSALHLAVRLLEENSEIITPHIITTPLTFVSTALVAKYRGIGVKFADIDEETYCIDPKKVDELMDYDTLAVLPVHYAGITSKVTNSKDMVIEDCAHAVGNHEAGKQGVMSCWSFHPVKNLATGDMGAITFDDETFLEPLKSMRWCGINLDTWAREKRGYNWEYNIDRLGYKYNTNDIMASIALVQLKRIGDMNERRNIIAHRYTSELADLPIILPPRSGSWHLYPIRVPSYYRNKLVEYLRDNHISPGVHYKPLHHYTELFGDNHDLPVTDRVYPELLSLPIHADLTETQQEKIIKVIKQFFKR